MAGRNHYQIVVTHAGLNKHRVVRGDERYIVEAAAQAQMRAWNEAYVKKVAAAERRRTRDDSIRELEDCTAEAEERTREAKAEMATARGILAATLRKDNRVDWQKLKQLQPFAQPQPVARPYFPIPPEPVQSEPRFQPHIGLLDKLWSGSAQKKQQAAISYFLSEHAAWVERVAAISGKNEAIYQEICAELAAWQKRCDGYESAREGHNAAIDRRRVAYQALAPEAVIDFCEVVLSSSAYPDFCPKQFEVGYRAPSQTVTLDYDLPAPNDLPSLAEVKYVRTRKEFQEVELTRKQMEALYGDVLSQVVIRTVHELFEADEGRAFDCVVFNGSVTAIDPASGNSATNCVLTLRVDRAAFLAVNLRNVDAQVCFRAIGGVAGPKSLDLRPVKPFGAIDRTGNRFTAAIDLSRDAGSPLDEWREIANSLGTSADRRFLSAGAVGELLGFPSADKFTVSSSRQLALAVVARGLELEPDPRYGAASFRSTDLLVLFRPTGTAVTDAYAGAASLLRLCVLIAAADGQVDEAELHLAREFIFGSLALNEAEQQRLNALEAVLVRQPELVKRSVAKVVKNVDAVHRRQLGKLLVCIAGADGKITSDEWKALDLAFRSLELAPAALATILSELKTDGEEVTLQPAGIPDAGEPLPATRLTDFTAPTFQLDMSRVARITQETAEVVGMLATVMSEDEPRPQTVPAPALALSIEAPLASLDLRYRPLVQSLAERDSWSRRDFEGLVAQHKLLPLGAFDAVNEWADEQFGDFVLEGEDPITFHRALLAKGQTS